MSNCWLVTSEEVMVHWGIVVEKVSDHQVTLFNCSAVKIINQIQTSS